MKELTSKDQFKERAWRAERPSVLFFYVSDCSLCHAVKKMLEPMEARLGKEIQFFRIDSQATPEIGEMLKIHGGPALAFIDGKSNRIRTLFGVPAPQQAMAFARMLLPVGSPPGLFRRALTLAQDLWLSVKFAIKYRTIQAPPQVVEYRLSLCEGCPFRRKELGADSCGKCGCFLRAKAQLAASKCPIGVW